MTAERPTPRVRRLGVGDAALYRTIRLDSLRLAPDSFSTRYEDELARPLQHFAETLGRAYAVAAFVGERIAGVARLHGAEDGSGTINGVFVYPEFRGAGIAATLLGTLIEGARGRFGEVTLGVAPDNRGAIALYERLLFRPLGHAPGSDGRDTLRMGRALERVADGRPC